MKTTAHIHTPAIVIDGDIIQVTPHSEHEYTLTTAEAALGYGVAPANIRKTLERHRDELKLGKHYYQDCRHEQRVTNSHARENQQVTTLWTKSGLIRLGFFIRSERAKRFRDMAEDLVLREWNREGDSELAISVGELAKQVGRLANNHEARLIELKHQVADLVRVRRREEAYNDPGDIDELMRLFEHPRHPGRGRPARSLESRRDEARHRLAEALVAKRGNSFRVPFQEIVRIGRALGLDEFQYEDFSGRFPEKGSPAMLSTLGKLVTRLLNGQTIEINGVEWSFVKVGNARGSHYRAIREN